MTFPYWKALWGITTVLAEFLPKAAPTISPVCKKTPVLLVVDAKGMSVSALAFIKGYLQYKEDSRIAGVIFNRMSEMLYREIAPMAEKRTWHFLCRLCAGTEGMPLRSRHLGLVMPDEVENLQEQVNLLAETLKKTLDFEKNSCDCRRGRRALGKNAGSPA